MSEMYANKWDISSEGTPQMPKWYLVTYELNVYVIVVLCKVFLKTFSRWQIVIFLNASTTFAYSKSFCNAIYFQVSFFCSKQHSWLLLFHPFLCAPATHDFSKIVICKMIVRFELLRNFKCTFCTKRLHPTYHYFSSMQ